jgi:hypothetical protein
MSSFERFGGRLTAWALLAVAAASTWLVSAGAASATTGSVNVFVGYADTVRAASSQFPNPWNGSAGVTFLGCSPSASCVFDGGAVRVSNDTTATVHVDDVKVHIDTCTYDLWGASMPVTLAPGHDLIVAQTATGQANGCTTDGRMDTSDVGPGGAKWEGVCTPNGIIPTVDVTVDGVTHTQADTGQVLNTGGVDGADCAHGGGPAGDESQSWTPIGQSSCPGAGLIIANRGGSPATGTANSTYTGSFTVSARNCTGSDLHSMKLQGGTTGWLSSVSSTTRNPATGTVTIKNNPAHVVSWSGFNLATGSIASITVNVTGKVPKGSCGSTLPISGNWSASGVNTANNSVSSGQSTAATISVTC